MSAAPTEFRRWMGRWASGVSIVTARSGETDAGLTVNSFLSVTLEPPTVLVALTHLADTTPVLEAARSFAVNLLAFDQRPLSERFALPSTPAEKFELLPLRRGRTGAALLEGTLGAIEAEVEQTFDVADHRLFLGRVVALHPGRDVAPLLFFRSRYSESDGGRSILLAGAEPAPKG
jgi:flavin reductase (DIM6/NTAB) family NADH-FMN oxidoreductase RutF